DVPEAAQVAEGDLAGGVDAVVADAEVGGRRRRPGPGLEAGVEGDQGCASVEGAVWALLVVVGAEGVELSLQEWERGRRWLLSQEPLEGLVEALDLAAGLGVIGG